MVDKTATPAIASYSIPCTTFDQPHLQFSLERGNSSVLAGEREKKGSSTQAGKDFGRFPTFFQRLEASCVDKMPFNGFVHPSDASRENQYVVAGDVALQVNSSVDLISLLAGIGLLAFLLDYSRLKKFVKWMKVGITLLYCYSATINAIRSPVTIKVYIQFLRLKHILR